MLRIMNIVKLLLTVSSILQVHGDDNNIQLGGGYGDLSNGFYFQLKLFWEDGMIWQNYEKSQGWCATCTGFYCDVGDHVMITKCLEHMDDQKWIFYDDGRVKPLINSDACVTTDRKIEGYVRLETCRQESDDYQRFQLFNNNIFDKFQFHPRRDDKLCLTNDHHPKEGERLKFESCIIAKENDKGVYDDTSHWGIGAFDGHKDINP